MRMAARQPPQAMTTGSMACPVLQDYLKEFVERVMISLAPCLARAKMVAQIAVWPGCSVIGAG